MHTHTSNAQPEPLPRWGQWGLWTLIEWSLVALATIVMLFLLVHEARGPEGWALIAAATQRWGPAELSGMVAQAGIDALLKNLRRHPKSVQVHATCHWALGVIATENAANQVLIAEQGGIDAVLASMGRHPASVQVQDMGCQLLGRIASHNTKNQATIGAQGGIDALLRALRRHPESLSLQQSCILALRVLAANATNQVALSVGLFCHIIGLFCHIIGLFCHIIGLFCHIIGLLTIWVGLF